MIRLVLYQNKKKEFIGVDTLGHAESVYSGYDLVCSAVSILVLNTVNSIERLTNSQIREEISSEDGYIRFRLLSNPSKDTELLFKSMVLGLKDMEEDENYSKYIELNFEEV